MSAEVTTMASKEFLSTLPEEMVMLALEAVELQKRIDGMTDKQACDDIQHQLELIKRRIIHSAARLVYQQ